MRKRQERKLRLNRETVHRLEREPLKEVVAALAQIGVKDGANTSPLCVATCCASGCDECDSGRAVLAPGA
jgi:hypothetical protein